MTPRTSATAALVAVIGSVAVHVSGLVGLAPGAPEVRMAGGTTAGLARIGDGFEDLVSGTISPVDGPGTAPDDSQVLPSSDPEQVVSPVDTTAPAPDHGARPIVAPSATAEMLPPTMAVAAVAEAAAAPAASLSPAQPQSLTVTAPARAAERLAALPPSVVPPTAPPTETPPDLDKARPRPKPTARATATEGEPPAPSRATPAKRGNSDRDETRGAPDGTAAEGDAVARGEGGGSQQVGNGSVENYGGKVLRKIMKTRKVKAPGRGIVIVGFSIAADGSLAKARVLRSSGDAALDAVALDHIRRAQPFPRPPAGLTREWSFEFEGR